jgi:hypothetical protein
MNHSSLAQRSAALTESSKAHLPMAAPLKPKGGDPYFGLSRSFWYNLERKGYIVLKRLRLPGNRKGRVLLSMEDAEKAIQLLTRDSKVVKLGGCLETSND